MSGETSRRGESRENPRALSVPQDATNTDPLELYEFGSRIRDRECALESLEKAFSWSMCNFRLVRTGTPGNGCGD